MFSRTKYFISIILISALTACGGGGGGGGGDDTTPTSDIVYDGTHRVSMIEYDYDNNGVVDATGTITYSNNAKTVTSTYEYIGDGTPDIYIRGSDAPRIVSIVTYSDSGKQLSFSMEETKSSGAMFTIIFSYAYNTDGTLQKLTTTVNGNAFVYDVNYTNGVISSLTTSDVGQPEATFTYETDGSLKSADFSNLGVTARNDYVWRPDGQLISINTQYSAPTPASSYTLFYDGNGKITSATHSSGEYPTSEDLNLTETYTWTGNLLTRLGWDPLSTGTVISTQTMTWEDGDCLNMHLETLGWGGGYALPFFTRDQSTVFVPGIFSLNPICSP